MRAPESRSGDTGLKLGERATPFAQQQLVTGMQRVADDEEVAGVEGWTSVASVVHVIEPPVRWPAPDR